MLPKKCPFSQRAFSEGPDWNCKDQTCRFNVAERCAITTTYLDLQDVKRKLDAIAKAVGVLNSPQFR